MPRPLLVRGARQLLTLNGPPGPRRGFDMHKLSIIPDGAVLIMDGRIREVGPSRRVEALQDARRAQEINASGRVVMPGLVDCHTHLFASLPRAADLEALPPGAPAGQPAPLIPGFRALVRAISETPPAVLQSQAMRLIEEAVRHGTTTMDATSGFALSESVELKVLRSQATLQVRTGAVVCAMMAALDPPEGMEPAAYIDWLCSHLMPMVAKRRLAEFADICCDAGGYSLSLTRRFLEAAKACGLIPRMHAGQRASIGAAAAGVAAGASSIAHLVHVTEAEADAIAHSNTVATLLPGSVFYAGAGDYPPARMLIDRGAPVALASNYNALTSPSENMQMMIALACRKMRMTPAEAITAATVNAAYVLRRGGSIGCLANGRDADLIMLGVSDYREIPCHFGVNLVDMTIKRGEVIFQRSGVQWAAVS